MQNRSIALLVAYATICTATPAARAQSEARQETLANLSTEVQQQANAEGIAFRATAPELGEVGLVQRQPAPPVLTIQTTQNIFYTDNAFLLEDFKVDTWGYNGSISATFIPWAQRDWTPSLSVEQTFFRYDRVSELDFNAQSVEAALKYDLVSDDTLSLRGSYSLTRIYTSRLNAGDVYKFGVLDVRLTHFRALGERGVSPFFFSGAFGLALRNGDPSAFDRFEISLPLTVLYTPFEHVQIFAFIRPSLQFYTNDFIENDRKDFNLGAGLGASYQVASWLSVGANFVWTGNYSTAQQRDYEVATPGLSVTAKIAF